MEQRKKRSSNFKPNEEDVLVTLVKKYVHIVESKKTDAISNTEKNKTWEKICQEYCGITGDIKTPLCLRNKFNNMKKSTRKKFADEKKYIFCTGGGPPPTSSSSITDTQNTIRSIMGDTLTGYSSEFDGDSILKTTNAADNKENSTLTDEYIMIEYVSDTENFENQMEPEADVTVEASKHTEPQSVDETQDNDLELNQDFQPTKLAQTPISSQNWTKYTPSKLKGKKSEMLQVPTRTNKIQQKIATWAIAKAELAELQKKAFLEEHELKLRHMQEKHEKFLKIQMEEWNLNKVHMKEEHQLKMANLKKNT